MNRVLRRSRWRPMVRASASLLLCLALGVDAQAQNLCATQASQRNPVAVESSGVGGTGAPARGAINTLKGGWRTALGWHGLDGVDSPGGVGGTGAVAGRPGLGGTGISEGGIGGTGIVGVITGFASICVNGVEVHFDASAVGQTPTREVTQRNNVANASAHVLRQHAGLSDNPLSIRSL